MNEIVELFQFEFFRNAMWASVFVSILSGIIGTYIVTKRIVFISGGITHASFGGIGIGYYLGINPLLGAFVFAILSAIGIEYLSINKKLRYDSLIGIFWSLGMTLGIIFIYLTPGYAPNLMSYLFGNILTITSTEVTLMAITAFVISIFFFIFIKPIIFISYNEEFALTRINSVKLFKYILIIFTALVVVLSIRVIGVILVISLLTIPQTIASMLTKRFDMMIIISILTSFFGLFIGLILSYFLNIPSGAMIILVLFILFFMIKPINLFLKRKS